MSADMLRRAAAELRDRVGHLPEPWRSRPWRVVQSDTESLDGLAACHVDHADDPHGAFDCCWSGEPVGHQSVAALAARMHPPVALALATVLDETARYYDSSYDDRADPSEVDSTTVATIALARAILREETP